MSYVFSAHERLCLQVYTYVNMSCLSEVPHRIISTSRSALGDADDDPGATT
jgi:hypothetical protein